MKMKKTKAGLAIVILLAGGLIGARIYLPYWVKDYVNEQINALKGYGGGVQDIDISLWRGAYQIEGLEIHKNRSGGREPFVSASSIDLSVEWKALLHGAIVAEIDIYNIDLNFMREQTGEGANWPELVDKLSPFDINRLSLHKGHIAFIDHGTEPDINVFLDISNAEVTNLRNVENKKASLPSTLTVNGSSIGKGDLAIEGKVNILKAIPDFDLGGKLENTSLPAFNNYAKAFAGIDFENGTMSIYTELAAANGRLKGYVKPVASNVAIIEEHDDDVLGAVWQAMAAAFADLFKNHSRDQFAFRIPVEGNLDNPEQDGWSTFISIFQNAFGKAFIRDTDGTINFSDLLEESSEEK